MSDVQHALDPEKAEKVEDGSARQGAKTLDLRDALDSKKKHFLTKNTQGTRNPQTLKPKARSFLDPLAVRRFLAASLGVSRARAQARQSRSSQSTSQERRKRLDL